MICIEIRWLIPGPFAPPGRRRPSLKITALSYSCTTWQGWYMLATIMMMVMVMMVAAMMIVMRILNLEEDAETEGQCDKDEKP